MRVHIYRQTEGKVALLFEPSLGKHKVPVLVKGLSRSEVRGQAAKEVAAMRGEKSPAPG